MNEGLDNAELADLYRRYGFFLRRRCVVLLRDEAHADDALQESFMKLMRAGAGVRTAAQPMRWLYRVVDRTCFDHLRKVRRGAARDVTLEDAGDALPVTPGTTLEERQSVLEILDVLDDEERAIAVMAFVDGMTHQEIASELGYSRMTILKRVASIRERAEKASARLARARAAKAAKREGRPS
ncbi:MAG: sigma-70 family RNA polymerase sigma factor [Labilithrix sp.]|nr:sigma-70 family RNA polymerase sigma factor [Labilithrix sp.]MCW5810846.1 sigma-70 family RNA polymerase sigma factor [Labilithrix sp.]